MHVGQLYDQENRARKRKPSRVSGKLEDDAIGSRVHAMTKAVQGKLHTITCMVFRTFRCSNSLFYT